MQSLRISFIILIALLTHVESFSQTTADSIKTASSLIDSTKSKDEIIWTRPKPFAFVTKLPKTLAWAAKESFSKKSIPAWCAITGSTLALIAYDQKIRDGITNASDYIGLHSDTDYKTIIGLKLGSSKIPIYEFPRNINSVFYSFGEGSASIMICGGLSLYGILKKDNRSRQTSSQILQAQLALGITSQILKRAAGRESPRVSTGPGGIWRPFVKPSEYQKRTSHHDAFPSGHLATMMATVTVLVSNYPEKKWIGPVGYSLIGLTGLAMINNGVHWAGDYPLALGIGYICGKVAVKMNRIVNTKTARR